MNDVDGDEMHDDSDDWMDSIDRGGGLKHITQMVYLLFTSIEPALRRYIGLDQPSLTTMKDKIIDDEGVQSSWSTIAVDWEETATLLLNMIVDTWIKIRGHLTARAWLESYKLQQKSVQKSKGIRKQLISSTSSTLASTFSKWMFNVVLLISQYLCSFITVIGLQGGGLLESS